MLRFRIWACLIFTLVFLFACSGSPPRPEPKVAPGLSVQVGTRLRDRLQRLIGPFNGKILGDTIRAKNNLPKFYRLRDYAPAWTDDFGPSPRVQKLLQSISQSHLDGFRPEVFHLSAIRTLLEDIQHRRQLEMDVGLDRYANLDLLLTDAYLTLANQLETGKIAPSQAGHQWYIPRRDRKNLPQVLVKAVEMDQIQESLIDLLPKQRDYWRLREILAQYQEIARNGGWKLIQPGEALKPGKRNNRVPRLRARLLLSKDLVEPSPGITPSPEAPKDPMVFDPALEAALKRFQKRHGLIPSGTLKKATLLALNTSVYKRIRQIEINMERWRWLPRDFGKRSIIVNIANYELQTFKQTDMAMRMPVVVGNQYKQTPVFSGMMTSVVLNPYWFIPRSIITDKILPALRKDPDYLSKHHITVLQKSDNVSKWEEVDVTGVDWNEVDDRFDFLMRQDPGPANSLGRVKFIFPNRFSIYLHDTPSKSLFKKGVRSFSSGCIRLSRPMDLLEFVLQGEPGWPEEAMNEKLQEEFKKEQEQEISLKHPIPVHMLYQTAWVEADGTVNFRADIYGQDELLDPLF